MSNILDYLLEVLLNSFYQLIILFGPLILLALIMNQLSRQNEIMSIRLMGMKAYLYIFGWLGTSIHESGHAVFAIIFGHRIREVKLFSLNPYDQRLGYVNHEYNTGSIYQQIGNFFIGIGPVLFGSIVLFTLSYFLFNFQIKESASTALTSNTLFSLLALQNFFEAIGNGFIQFSIQIVQNLQQNWWKLIIFIYLAFSIGGSITLSKADISSSVKGFIYIILFIILINLATNWAGNFIIKGVNFISIYLSYLYILLIITIGINLFFFLILSGISLTKRKKDYYYTT